jgi:hypothetical protein
MDLQLCINFWEEYTASVWMVGVSQNTNIPGHTVGGGGEGRLMAVRSVQSESWMKRRPFVLLSTTRLL